MDKQRESYKVVLVGETGVGKTSILAQFLHQDFSSEVPTTLCAIYSATTIPINEKEIKLEIWDTAGQEKYRTLTKIFYNDTSVALLVYDITNLKSFDEIKKYWSKEIKENSPTNFITVLVSNKSDLYEKETVDETEARAFAKEIGAMFKRISAKNAEGVESLFTDIGRAILHSMPNLNRDVRANSIKISSTNQSQIEEPAFKENDKRKKCC